MIDKAIYVKLFLEKNEYKLLIVTKKIKVYIWIKLSLNWIASNTLWIELRL